jgi:hypothetical protein
MTSCCYVSITGLPCPSLAEWLVYDEADCEPDAAGTEACTEHVGALLGRRPHLDQSAEWAFRVVRLAPETKPMEGQA